jgi:hypothetical protein
MKAISSVIACISIIMGSCSTYKEVSLNSFKEYNIAESDWGNIQYVLKGHKLLYTDIDSRNNVYLLETDKSTIKDSYSYLIQDNIMIPKGSSGVCVGHSKNSLIIDFGKGIIVQFVVSDVQNRANSELVIDERAYSLEISERTPSLYFNTRDLQQ